MLHRCGMRGFITESDFDEAEVGFPGIEQFYRSLKDKPRTFLELVWRYIERDLTETVTAPTTI
jgi:hypothetical protein